MYFLEKIKIDLAGKINKALGSDLVQASHFVYPPTFAKASAGKPDKKMGDLSLACFDIAKTIGKNPAEATGSLAEKIKSKKYKAVAAGPYLNFVVNPDIVVGGLKEIGKNKYGENKKGEKKKVMIEYSNANTHKEYHVGHLRNIAYGDSVNRILKANGYNAIPVSYINDFGIHVAKTLWFYKKHFNEDLKKKLIWNTDGELLGKLYALACVTIDNNPELKKEVGAVMKKIESRQGEEYELWKKTREWSIKQFDEIYKELGVKFNKPIFYESEVIDEGHEMVKKLLSRGILEKSLGATIADLGKYNLGILVVLRSDGTALYPVADIALAIKKFKDYNLDKSVYVVDIRQGQYFKQLFKLLELLGYKQEMMHLGYDFVKLPSGMMSSRTGNIITYELLKADMLAHTKEETKKRHEDWSEDKIEIVAQKIAFGAMKFEMIKVAKEQVITFDMEEAVRFDGFTSAYLQYTYARANSIIRKSGVRTGKYAVKNLKEAKEKNLIFKLLQYPEIIAKAGIKYDPSEIAKYLFETAQMFNDYYHSIQVLGAEEEVKKARLGLIVSTMNVLQNGLYLLGIDTVEEM